MWVWLGLGVYLLIGLVLAGVLLTDDVRTAGGRQEPWWHLGLVVVGWAPMWILYRVRGQS